MPNLSIVDYVGLQNGYRGCRSVAQARHRTKSSCHPDYAHADPEHIEERISEIFFNNCAPRQNHGINRIECPDKQKRAIRAHPADDGKTENSHDHAYHLDGPNVPSHKAVHSQENPPVHVFRSNQKRLKSSLEE